MNPYAFSAVDVKIASGMAENNIWVLTFLVFIAVPAGSTFSALSWHCHRLVPRFITYSVTPCTYPCLVVSRHEQPHIVVQNEPDGTPCMIPKGFHHGGELGTCRSSVCTQDLHHKVLKRKKRFICLYTVARIIQLKRQRKRLQKQIGDLQQQLDRTGNRDNDSELGGRVYDSGSGGLSIGNTGADTGEAFSPENVGGLGSGPRYSRFPGSGSDTSEIDMVGSTGSERRGSAGRGFGATRNLPNGNNRRGSLSHLPTDPGEDSTGQVRIGGLEPGGLDMDRRNHGDDIANAGGNGGPGGEPTVWHE